jgi:aquaporin Z
VLLQIHSLTDMRFESLEKVTPSVRSFINLIYFELKDCHQTTNGESDGRMQTTVKNELLRQPVIVTQMKPGPGRGLPAAIWALKTHWPEYLIEAACLGLFMVSACSVTIALQHPASILRQAIASPFLRRALTGIAMGLTAIALIYSPWGKQSGAHLNPSITLAFFRLGRIEPWDAVFYVFAQFIGGTLAVLLSAIIWGEAIAHQNVRYAATLPGRGAPIAFVAELVISFLMMTMVLNVSNSGRIARFTGIIAGALVATYISLEAPLSGMSMSPARSFASALPGRLWNSLWIYFTAPPLGMLLAAEVYLRLRGKPAVFCAKFHHDNDKRCIFRCNYKALAQPQITLKETMQ